MNVKSPALAGLMLLLGSVWAGGSAHAGVVINPLFASSFSCPTSVCGIDPATLVSLQGNTQATGAINAAANQIAGQFSNNLTTNILFYGIHAGADGFLAASLSGNTLYTYNQFTTALGADAAANPQNITLNTAVANLGSGNGANDPSAFVAVNTTDARVLGLGVGAVTSGGTQDQTPQFSATGNFLGGGGVVDGIVLLNLDESFDFTRPLPPASTAVVFDAQSAVEHEIDEVLGIGGAGSQLNNFNFDPNYARDFFGVSGHVFGVMDLYRYQGVGTPSFDPTAVSVTGCGAPTCSGLPSPYFSVDGGKTSIDTFNQAFALIPGDAGDWGLDLFHSCPGNTGLGGTGDVQDAFNCNNLSPDVKPGTASFAAFQAIGFNAVPEPGTWALMLLGFGGLGAALRRRRAGLAVAVAG